MKQAMQQITWWQAFTITELNRLIHLLATEQNRNLVKAKTNAAKERRLFF